jgi:hypothetical protein
MTNTERQCNNQHANLTLAIGQGNNRTVVSSLVVVDAMRGWEAVVMRASRRIRGLGAQASDAAIRRWRGDAAT